MKNKRKIIIAIIVIVSIILITYLFMPIKVKGYLIYGNKKCGYKSGYNSSIITIFGDVEHPSVAGQAMSPYKCNLCGKKEINSNTAVPDICKECAEKTGRCQQCGGLK